VQPPGRENMLLDTAKDRIEHHAAGADLVGQGGQAEWHAFPGVACGLPVERLVPAELLERNHTGRLAPAQPRGMT
jgi:hypothetical protein